MNVTDQQMKNNVALRNWNGEKFQKVRLEDRFNHSYFDDIDYFDEDFGDYGDDNYAGNYDDYGDDFGEL